MGHQFTRRLASARQRARRVPRIRRAPRPPPDRAHGLKAPRLRGHFPHAIENLAFETHGSYRAVAQPGQDLVRFSAFSNDRRVPRGGPIAAGTYFTSPLDAASVETGLSAAARYALPNPAPAIFRFDISIEPNPVPIACGTVAPRFNQSGGGVEIKLVEPVPVPKHPQSFILPAW